VQHRSQGRYKVIGTAPRGRQLFNPVDIAEAEALFSSLNKEIKSILNLSSILTALHKLDRLLWDSVPKIKRLSIAWSNQLEDFVQFLKVNKHTHLYRFMDD